MSTPSPSQRPRNHQYQKNLVIVFDILPHVTPIKPRFHLEHAVVSLSEGLQEANAARQYAEAVEEEGESSFEDPDRVGPVRLDCKVYERELANVMVWSCRHVCVCKRCDAALFAGW
ncbi:hypothetical protein SASPL_137027 [Salvia splendens]|uniref:Uncharacterized protein n=1 Tax=Salvia splendens TaxID=180675 RepID=A0A8X8ZD19_SALSN|nr:hypothetical protein SASPL_137027 [Salvia splendens]